MQDDRPNAADYPFNYLLHDVASPDGDPLECATYAEVESHITARWGECYVDPVWRIDPDWWPARSNDNRFRLIWRTKDAGRCFAADVALVDDDEDSWNAAVEAIRQRIARDAVAVIERCRTAYERALSEWNDRHASCPACGRGLVD